MEHAKTARTSPELKTKTKNVSQTVAVTVSSSLSTVPAANAYHMKELRVLKEKNAAMIHVLNDRWFSLTAPAPTATPSPEPKEMTARNADEICVLTSRKFLKMVPVVIASPLLDHKPMEKNARRINAIGHRKFAKTEHAALVLNLHELKPTTHVQLTSVPKHKCFWKPASARTVRCTHELTKQVELAKLTRAWRPRGSPKTAHAAIAGLSHGYKEPKAESATMTHATRGRWSLRMAPAPTVHRSPERRMISENALPTNAATSRRSSSLGSALTAHHIRSLKKMGENAPQTNVPAPNTWRLMERASHACPTRELKVTASSAGSTNAMTFSSSLRMACAEIVHRIPGLKAKMAREAAMRINAPIAKNSLRMVRAMTARHLRELKAMARHVDWMNAAIFPKVWKTAPASTTFTNSLDSYLTFQAYPNLSKRALTRQNQKSSALMGRGSILQAGSTSGAFSGPREISSAAPGSRSKSKISIKTSIKFLITKPAKRTFWPKFLHISIFCQAGNVSWKASKWHLSPKTMKKLEKPYNRWISKKTSKITNLSFSQTKK